MPRRLFTVTTALSLLLFVAIALLWARSAWTIDELSVAWWTTSNDPVIVHEAGDDANIVHIVGLTSGRGVIMIDWIRDLTLPWLSRERRGRWHYTGLSPAYVDVLPGRSPWHDAFSFDRSVTPGALHRNSELVLPLWVFLLVFAILPTIYAGGRWRRRHRLRVVLCAHCGYDLRASPDRCPECGMPSPQINTDRHR